MSFLKNFFNLFRSKKNIEITLKQYNLIKSISGFTKNNNYTLKQYVTYGTSIKDLLNNINKYRQSHNQIKHCYIDGYNINNINDYILTHNIIIHISL